MSQFENLHLEIKSNKKLSASHKTRLERLVALHNHVVALERERAASDNHYPYWKADELTRRLEQFKKPEFFLQALEALAAEVRAVS